MPVATNSIVKRTNEERWDYFLRPWYRATKQGIGVQKCKAQGGARMWMHSEMDPNCKRDKLFSRSRIHFFLHNASTDGDAWSMLSRFSFSLSCALCTRLLFYVVFLSILTTYNTQFTKMSLLPLSRTSFSSSSSILPLSLPLLSSFPPSMMQIVPPNFPKNPLDLPEIRTRVAYFLGRKDCLSCIRVSRGWFRDFVPSSWHTIDFENDAAAFTAVTPEVLDKYGGFIAQALNVEGPERLSALQHSRVDSVRIMDICLPGSWVYRELLSDLMLRCSGSIKDLSIRSYPPDPDTFEEQRKWAGYYMHVNDIFAQFPPWPGQEATPNQGRCLRTLSLNRVCITREGFSALLRCCPSLDKLTLFRVMFIRHRPAVTLYTGSSLRYLSASVAQVWCHDEEDRSAPCLLLHFPLLKEWNISQLDRSEHWTSDITPPPVNFSKWCPFLKTITFAAATAEYGSERTEIMTDLLLHSFEALEACILSAKNLVSSSTLGLISHQETLTSVTITNELLDATSMQWVHLIMKLCGNLEFFSFESLECNMTDCVWRSRNLKELRVRFMGLETKQDIDECVSQLCWSRKISCFIWARGPRTRDAIFPQVAQHLFQFKKLRAVWLGTKNYYLPPSLD